MNPSQLAVTVQDDRIRDSRRQAEVARLAATARERRRRDGRRAAGAADPERVVIRMATRGDGPALERIAQLEGRPLPRGATLVGELGGEVVAALGLADGCAIADPFRPTADLLALLRLRRDQLRGRAVAGDPPRRGLPGRAQDALRALLGRRRERPALLAGGGR